MLYGLRFIVRYSLLALKSESVLLLKLLLSSALWLSVEVVSTAFVATLFFVITN